MKVFAIHNRKGGVGKTTIAGNTAYYCSQSKKTILIDADSQGNSSSWYITEPVKFELADVLKGECDINDALVKIAEGFYILPSFTDGGLKDYAEIKLFQEPFIFRDLNDELERAGAELVIYDLSPGMSQLERTILSSADEIIIPLQPEFFSYDGLDMFIDEIKKINKNFKRDIKFDKIVCNGLNKSFTRHNAIYKKFEDMNFSLFTICQDSKIPEAQILHKSIFEYCPEARSIPELTRLSREMAV